MRADFEAVLSDIEQHMTKDGMLWVSWIKKSAKIPTDMTEDVIREIVLPRGLVDVKVCAVTEVWSELKIVWRKALRGGKND
jgi:hypothetical protein